MSTLGKTHSDETKRKISESMKARRGKKSADPEPYPPQAPGRPFDQRNQREL